MCLDSQQVTYLTVLMLLWLLHCSLSAFHRCYSFSKCPPSYLTLARPQLAGPYTCFILSWGQFIHSRNESRGPLHSSLWGNRNAFDTEVKHHVGPGSVWPVTTPDARV